jgi:hypothetical protein
MFANRSARHLAATELATMALSCQVTIHNDGVRQLGVGVGGKGAVSYSLVVVSRPQLDSPVLSTTNDPSSIASDVRTEDGSRVSL